MIFSVCGNLLDADSESEIKKGVSWGQGSKNWKNGQKMDKEE